MFNKNKERICKFECLDVMLLVSDFLHIYLKQERQVHLPATTVLALVHMCFQDNIESLLRECVFDLELCANFILVLSQFKTIFGKNAEKYFSEIKISQKSEKSADFVVYVFEFVEHLFKKTNEAPNILILIN